MKQLNANTNIVRKTTKQTVKKAKANTASLSADEKTVKDSLVKRIKADYKKALNSLKWAKPNGHVKFNMLAGINRAIIPTQVTKLATSLEKMYTLRPIVAANISFITGKNTTYIIDGQHLFHAHIRHGWDVPYVVIDIKNKQELVETIALLNASSKTWSMQDYVTAWSSLKPDYIKLNHYFGVYDLEISTIGAVLSNVTDTRSVGRKIKDGTFKIINEEENVQLLNYVTDMLKVVPRMSRFENRYACTEFIKFVRTTKCYNKQRHDKFIAELGKNKQKFILATQEQGKLSELFYKLTNSKN